MHFNTINLIYIGVGGLVFLPCFILAIFWFTFVLFRFLKFYKVYKKLSVSRYYNEFYIQFYNNKMKCIIYFFFLMIIILEILCVIAQCLGTLIFNFTPRLGNYPIFPLDISINCTDKGFEIWEIELINPLISLFFSLRDMILCANSILVIGLIKYIYLAYQMNTDLSSVKLFLIKASLLLPLLMIISVIPHTQILSKAAVPIYSIVLVVLLFKHKKLYVMTLKWRCDDAFILRDLPSYGYHRKVKRNSIILFNLLLSSVSIFVFNLTLHNSSSLASMLLTEKSKYVTALFHLNSSLSYLDCEHQQFIYKFQFAIDSITPVISFVSTVLYFMPYVGISLGILALKIYKYCKTPLQTRFEGNTNLFPPLRV